MSRQPYTSYLRAVLVSILLLTMTACNNVQLGYNWGDKLVLYYLDNYLDLNSAQKQQAAAGLQKLFIWHRSNELPAYSRELIRVQNAVQGPLNMSQLVATNEFMRARLERLALQGVPMMTDLLLSLSPAQVSYLREQLGISNAEYRDEYLAGDAQQQQANRYQQLLEQLQPWFGELDSQQLAVLRVANSDWPVDNQFWYGERLYRQHEMLALIDFAVTQKPSHADLSARLRAYIVGFETDREAGRQANILSFRQHMMDLIVALANRSSVAQRQQAVAHAQRWINDFGELVAQQ